ncbi:Lar family restriction alleviation protein [Hymenobacter sp. BT186]|uniref:Lar family restriction alleviation protein n=1 Tax=Hymenobacter telluris TaxID=2816474 RepID=A0A939J9B8_9BACT|nr:Lar family restriction alleviation protein [Hymenobacter telluris]MBO0358644.1 Lar family restriction alleviation protein [Hymenobacter telluris]MBW3374670.1 Lar family restriction alleviation protein [Hymenobacter norwichensis]
MTENQTTELLPCPFCGGELRWLDSWARSFNPPRKYLEIHHDSEDCFIRKGIIFSSDEKREKLPEFIRKWNTRAPSLERAEPVSVGDGSALKRLNELAGTVWFDEFNKHDQLGRWVLENFEEIVAALSQQQPPKPDAVDLYDHINSLQILIDKFNDKENGGLPRVYMFAWLSDDAPKLLTSLKAAQAEQGGGE